MSPGGMLRLAGIVAFLLWSVNAEAAVVDPCEDPQNVHDCVLGCLLPADGSQCCVDNFSGAEELHCLWDVICYHFPNNPQCSL
jgi:hypothetical protein